MNKDLYETTYRDKRHFSFGRNWQEFLRSLTPERKKLAEESLTSFLGGKEALSGKTFVDIGCGSGLFSLAAYLLGAKRIISVDIDDFSLECTRSLHVKEGSPENWQVIKGSALDEGFLASLGKFDIVYSWGVLHHTGDMYKALKNIVSLIEPHSGKLYTALYNESTSLLEGTSRFWLWEKKLYNNSPVFGKKILEFLYIGWFVLGLLMHGKNPFAYIRSYQSVRGMNFFSDIKDWIGGYPYEYASIEKVKLFFQKFGLRLTKTLSVRSIGCNEFLFEWEEERESPEVTVLLSVKNGGTTLERALQSVSHQTYKNLRVTCVDDASTDNTQEILRRFQERFTTERFSLVTHKENKGLTKSLNEGLSLVKTPLCARIDADDWWEETKLEKQVAFLERNPDYGIVGCFYENYKENEKRGVILPETDEAIKRSILRRNPFAHSAVLFRTSLIEKVGGYTENVRYGQDYDLWLKASRKAKYYNIPEFLCHRDITGGISVEKRRFQMWQGIKTQTRFMLRYRDFRIGNVIALFELLLMLLIPEWLRKKLSSL